MHTTLPNYEIIKVIGSGSFGYVFEAYDWTHKRKVALKRIEKVGQQLSREYEILYDLKDSIHVVKILDFYYSRSVQDKLVQNIVFEYMDDNLENMLDKNIKGNKHFTQYEIKSYGYQILKAADYIHSKGISHRDLKPENILTAKDSILKLCDFGSSKQIDQKGKNTPYIVSRYYRAPELILCITTYSTAIDIWAIGCILAELITNQPLFQGKTEGDQLFSIFKVMGSPSQEVMQTFCKRVPFDPKLFDLFNIYQGEDLIQKFSRLSDKENFVDLLKKMLEILPDNRISAAEALKHPFFDEVREETEDLFEKLNAQQQQYQQQNQQKQQN